MPVTMGGLASGMDTDSIIKKLLKVESQPIKKYKRAKSKSNQRKKGIDELSKYLKALDKDAKKLYGFRASYEAKKAFSSDETILVATASKRAEKGIKKIEVLKVASSHKISTDTIDEKKKLPKGKFRLKVDEDEFLIKFKGGTLEKLREKIDDVASSIVSSSYIRTYGKQHVLTLQSLVSGKKGEIKIKGDISFLKEIGLVSGEKDGKKTSINLTFDKRYFGPYLGKQKMDSANGSIKVGDKGNSFKIKGLLWQEYTLPLQIDVKENTVFNFNFKYNKKKKEERDSIPYRIEFGPKENIVIKGIKLNDYNISRIRSLEKKKKEKKFETLIGVGIVSDNNGKRIEKIYQLPEDAKGKQEFLIGKDFKEKKISKVIFYCNKGDVSFDSAKISTPIKGKNELQAKNEINKAENTLLRIEGIEIEREKNDGITDVIKGVTLTVKGKSEKPVELKIEHDIAKSVGNIKQFVDSYNKYLEFHKALTKTQKIDKPGRPTSDAGHKGLFIGDMEIIRLENAIKRSVNAAYSNRAEKPIKIISDTGVSTGKVNSDWKVISTGKLVIDQDQLENVIRTNPEGIKMFFGSDSDGDNRPDTGMGYSLVKVLKPYITSGRNVLVSKKSLEDDIIKNSDERIEKLQAHLKAYEQKLRSKFGSMEKAMAGAKSQRNWMKQQSGGGQK